MSIVGGFGPWVEVFTLSAEDVLAEGSTTARSLAVRFGEVVDVKDHGAAGNGSTDDTAAIQAAITAAGTGRLFFPPGTYPFNATLTRPIGQTWEGASRQSVELLWTGGNNTSLVTNAYASGVMQGGIHRMSFSSGSATGITLLHVQNERQAVYEDLYLNANNGAGNIGLFLEGGAASQALNTAHNSFRYIYIDNATTGIRLAGTSTGIATDNSFLHLNANLTSTAAGTGLEFQSWSDSNTFFFTRLTLEHINSTGVVFNSVNPTENPSTVYNELFYCLMIDNIGTVTGSTAVQLNASRGIRIEGLFFSPSPFTDTPIGFNSFATSYYITSTNMSAIGGIGKMEVFSSGINNGDLTVPHRGLDAGYFYHTPTSGALVGAAIGFGATMYATPFPIGDTSVVKTLSFNVTTGAGGNWNAAMAIYADNSFFRPGALIANSDTGSIAVATGFTGVKTSAVLNGGSGITLPRGLYWLVFMADNVGASVSSVDDTSGGTPMGAATIGASSAVSAFTKAIGSSVNAAQTYGAFPSTFPTATKSGGSAVPAVVVGA